MNLFRSRFGFIYLWFYWNPLSYVTHSKWARCFLNCYICNYFHEFLLNFMYQTQLSHSRFAQSICSLGLDSFLGTCWLLSIPYLPSQLALSHTSSKGWASAVSLTILNSKKIMASFTTSGFWWIVPTWGMKSGLHSRCLKEPGNTGCKCIRGIRWMPLGMKYGSEKELKDIVFFLPLLNGLFYSMVIPHDLSGGSSCIFMWSSASLGTHYLVFAFHSSLLHFPFSPQSCCSGIILPTTG